MRRFNKGAMEFGDVPDFIGEEDKVEEGWWNRPEWSNPVRDKLKSCGAMSGISWQARIYQPEQVAIGRGCRIDDFVHMLGGDGVEIGDRVHISPFVSVEGGGQLTVGNYAGIAAGVRIVTGSEALMRGHMTNPCCPLETRRPVRKGVIIGDFALVFTGAIVLPGVIIGEGSVVAAGTLVSKSVPGWHVLAADGRMVQRQGREELRAREKELIERYGF